MIYEIERFITKNYYELLAVCNKITKDSSWSGDLLNDVILQLYDKETIKLDKLDDNNIKYYIIKCLNINWHSKTSPFYRKVRRESTLYDELYESISIIDENEMFDKHKLLDIVELEWAEMNWFNKIIFEKYMVIGSLKGVSRDTTIPLTSIKRYVDETKEMIKINALNKFENE